MIDYYRESYEYNVRASGSVSSDSAPSPVQPRTTTISSHAYSVEDDSLDPVLHQTIAYPYIAFPKRGRVSDLGDFAMEGSPQQYNYFK